MICNYCEHTQPDVSPRELPLLAQAIDLSGLPIDLCDKCYSFLIDYPDGMVNKIIREIRRIKYKLNEVK